MHKELNDIIINEAKALDELLKALEEQHGYIVKKDILGMERCVSIIEQGNREIAAWEVNRRDNTKGRAMSLVIEEEKNEELETNYRKIKMLLQETLVQKETNELLIKQGLSFTNRILGIINPDRSVKTYNSYGKVKR